MRRASLVALSTALAGCASSYDCGRFEGEPPWQLVAVDRLTENALLGAVLEHRERPLSSLSSGFLWYRGGQPFPQQYLFCVPPTDRLVREKAGCFAERYIFRREGSEYVFVEDMSVICT